MPRATHHQQYQRHQTLREINAANPIAIARLDARAQVALIAFYEPHRAHTLESLRSRQRELARHYPSLPQQAGKAYVALLDLLPKLEALKERPRASGAKAEIVTFSEPQLNIDPNEMARLLIRAMQERDAGFSRDNHDEAA